ARRDGSALALIMIDLDYFKSINDTLGHAGGDWVLRVAAEALASELRPTDLAGRLGGEEFGVVMPGLDMA
ncbi:diguanylate cyclase, partial [Vibrio parahaemolyticus]